MSRTALIISYLSAVAVFAVAVWWIGFRAAIPQVAERGAADLRSAAERLVGHLARYQQTAVMLADHPEIINLTGTGASDQAADVLRRVADQIGAMQIAVVAPDGTLLAGAFHAPDGPTAQPGFQRAMTGALGRGHIVTAQGRRAFSYYAPVFVGSDLTGAIIVRVDMETIEESDWRGAPEVVFFTDDAGEVFVTNRSELLFQKVGDNALAPTRRRNVAGEELWSIDGSRYLPQRAVYIQAPLNQIDMQGHVLISIRPADRIAILQAVAVAALCLTFGAFLFLATERRRALKLANLTLEARVEERTEELHRAQADLVQAGKLSALGQMSAGISHELNQPLMAIRSFSENAELFLDRGDSDTARQNLGRISELSRRMARIIKNLRAFARQEHEPMTRVDIVAVMDAVLELTDPRLRQNNVDWHWTRPDGPVWVKGGEVRLQQVMMNLINNAMDAMAGQQGAALFMTISRASDTVTLELRDTGPGLDDPEKIFDPFYSTKEVGAEGMGLGLSISYGLVQSFGGAIRGRNHPGGGAVFTVELTAEDA